MKKILIIWALLISVCFAQSKAGFYVVGGKVITVQDTSSRKYLKAVENAGVVPSVVQNFASNYLVTIERAISTYSLMTAQYPFIGGTAGTHKFNLNDPRDADGAFRLVFTNGATHDANGVLFNGTNQSANTFFNPTSVLSNPKTDIALSAYINGGTLLGASFPSFMGSTATSNLYSTVLAYRTTLAAFTPANQDYAGNISIWNFGSRENGYLLGNSKGTKVQTWFKGVKRDEQTLNASGLPANGNMAIGGVYNINAGTVGFFQNIRLGIVSISEGFTDTQAILQSRAVTSFEGFLGRQ